MKRSLAILLMVMSMLSVATPALATQPGQVGHADGRNGGNSAPGPHCHYNLVASEHNNSGHGLIITAAIHQAHVQTGLPTGIFQATACPS